MPYNLKRDAVAQALEVTPRRVLALVAKGMPCKKQGRGKTSLFDLKKAKKWYAENIKNVKKMAKQNEKHTPPFKLVSTKDVETNSDLESMVIRLRQMDISSHNQLLEAIKKKAPREVIAALQGAWNKNVSELAKFEKILPAIMHERGKYGSIAEMRRGVKSAYTQASSILDQVGTMVADRCVGKKALEIKNIVDEGVSDAKRMIVDGTNKFKILKE